MEKSDVIFVSNEIFILYLYSTLESRILSSRLLFKGLHTVQIFLVLAILQHVPKQFT